MLRLKKSLGQNFLVDKNVINKLFHWILLRIKKFLKLDRDQGI